MPQFRFFYGACNLLSAFFCQAISRHTVVWMADDQFCFICQACSMPHDIINIVERVEFVYMIHKVLILSLFCRGPWDARENLLVFSAL